MVGGEEIQVADQGGWGYASMTIAMITGLRR